MHSRIKHTYPGVSFTSIYFLRIVPQLIAKDAVQLHPFPRLLGKIRRVFCARRLLHGTRKKCSRGAVSPSTTWRKQYLSCGGSEAVGARGFRKGRNLWSAVLLIDHQDGVIMLHRSGRNCSVVYLQFNFFCVCVCVILFARINGSNFGGFYFISRLTIASVFLSSIIPYNPLFPHLRKIGSRETRDKKI